MAVKFEDPWVCAHRYRIAYCSVMVSRFFVCGPPPVMAQDVRQSHSRLDVESRSQLFSEPTLPRKQRKRASTASSVEVSAEKYTGISMVYAVIMLSLWATLMQATPANPAVSLAFQQADASLTHFALLQRTGVTEQLDLVVMIGSPKALQIEHTPWTWWTEERKIGLFLQEKARPDRVYWLGMRSGFPDCAARIERVTVTDSVISCQGEKSQRYPNQKWVYDVRAKSLLRQFSYQPFAMYRAFQNTNVAFFVGCDNERLVAVEYRADREPAFRVLGDADARPWIARVHTSVGIQGMERRRTIYIDNDKAPPPASIPALPRTTYDQFAAARPRRVKDGYGRAGTEIKDSIGPWQQEDGRIWFAKTFYDGEGSTGVGGFGYFDISKGRLRMFAPSEIADWSVSAIDVGPDAVWMALVQNGEYGGSSGGLLRYDRQTDAVRRLGLPDITVRLIRAEGKILAATDFGLAVIAADEVKRYFIDRTMDGRLRVVPATR
jgi:hypothetical protein